ncbi:hypothetical protein DMO16_03855 [Fictibacillus sp. S7]|nr:hypothetical protein DMO16_03855 [Fictibacillus sp. S7]
MQPILFFLILPNDGFGKFLFVPMIGNEKRIRRFLNPQIKIKNRTKQSSNENFIAALFMLSMSK